MTTSSNTMETPVEGQTKALSSSQEIPTSSNSVMLDSKPVKE